MILQCNDLPKLGGNDGGVWRRVEVVKYISKFMDNPRPCEADPHQYQIDDGIYRKLMMEINLYGNAIRKISCI